MHTRRACLLVFVWIHLPALGAAQDGELPSVEIPKLVSGRSAERFDQVKPADVLARVKLVEEHCRVILAYMGRTAPPPTLMSVKKASTRDVFSQAVNLERRGHELALELLRIPGDKLSSAPPNLAPYHILRIVNQVLETVLRVKAYLGLVDTIDEVRVSDETTPTEVFNALLQLGALMNELLEQRTTDTVVYQALTIAAEAATHLHAKTTRKFLPEPVLFVPNKSVADAYRAVESTTQVALRIARRAKVSELELLIDEPRIEQASPDDVVDLVALLIAELSILDGYWFDETPHYEPYASRRRYPSHAYQLARFIELVLLSLEKNSKRLPK